MDPQTLQPHHRPGPHLPPAPHDRTGGDLALALSRLRAEVLAVYLKTRNYHWRITGPNCRSHHLMLDLQGEQIFATTDAIAERERRASGGALRCIRPLPQLQRLFDSQGGYASTQDMLLELADDNRGLVGPLHACQQVCRAHGELASAALIAAWSADAECRAWALHQAARAAR